jgi:hypothetical protein
MDTSGAGPVHRHDLAAVPARPGVHDVGPVEGVVILQRISMFFVLEIGTRSVHLLGATTNPNCQ